MNKVITWIGKTMFNILYGLLRLTLNLTQIALVLFLLVTLAVIYDNGHGWETYVYLFGSLVAVGITFTLIKQGMAKVHQMVNPIKTYSLPARSHSGATTSDTGYAGGYIPTNTSTGMVSPSPVFSSATPEPWKPTLPAYNHFDATCSTDPMVANNPMYAMTNPNSLYNKQYGNTNSVNNQLAQNGYDYSQVDYSKTHQNY